MEEVVKHRIRTTPPTFMCDAEVHDKVDTPRFVRHLDVSMPTSLFQKKKGPQMKTREENGPFHLPGAMATFGGNKKRAQASAIPGTQKRIKICVYDTPPQVLCPTTGREL